MQTCNCQFESLIFLFKFKCRPDSSAPDVRKNEASQKSDLSDTQLFCFVLCLTVTSATMMHVWVTHYFPRCITACVVWNLPIVRHMQPETEPCCDKRGLLFFGRRGTWQNVDLHVWSMVWSFDKWMSSGLCPFSWDDWRAKYVKRSKTVGLSDLYRTAVLLGKFQMNVLD